MATQCDKFLANDILPSCDYPLVKGFEADGVIIPREYIDFASSSISATNANIIEGIILKTGKRGYQCQQMGSAPFSGSTQTLTVGTYSNTWESSIQVLVPTWGALTANQIVDALTNSDNVVILRNKTKTDGLGNTEGNAEYQVYGWWQGCRASAGERDANSDDTLGGVLMTLTESGSPRSGMFYFTTNATATAAAYQALYAE